MELHELPDLSDWRNVEVWTIEEASLLWSSIEPMNYIDVRIKDLKTLINFRQYIKAMTLQRAIVEAVCIGNLSFVEAWEDGEYSEKKVSYPDLPDHAMIIKHRTRITQAAFMKWIRSKEIPSMRAIIGNSEKRKPKSLKESEKVSVEDAKPIYSNPLMLGYLSIQDKTHSNYSPKLDAAITAWMALNDDPDLARRGTVKQSLVVWLTARAAEYELLDDHGKPMTTAILQIAALANYKTKGGAPKTPGKSYVLGTSVDAPYENSETEPEQGDPEVLGKPA